MKKFLYCLNICSLSFVIFFVNFHIKAQEYPTDRLFMKQFKKSKCLQDVEERVSRFKKKREMTLEHENLLNNNIWYKIRAKLPLSSGEMKRFLNLRSNGIASNKLTSKKLWAKKEKEFNLLRYRCKK